MTVQRCPSCGAQLVQRSNAQNALLHTLIRDISEQKSWAGQWLYEDDWKRLLVAAWERTQGRTTRVLPSLDHAGFEVLYQRTSRLSKADLSSLCDYILAWGIDQGVKFSAPAEVLEYF